MNIRYKAQLIVGMLIATSIVPMVTAYGAFADVSSDHQNSEAIEYVRSSGIVKGYPDGTFRPDVTINRAEFTKIVVGSAFAKDAIDSCAMGTNLLNSYIIDVPKNAWFTQYICYALDSEIVYGYPDRTFRPERTINFAEAAKIIAATYFKAGIAADTTWYKPYVQQLADHHAIPTSIHAFDQLLTRGEMAEIIYRLKANITTKPSLTYEDIANNTGASPSAIPPFSFNTTSTKLAVLGINIIGTQITNAADARILQEYSVSAAFSSDGYRVVYQYPLYRQEGVQSIYAGSSPVTLANADGRSSVIAGNEGEEFPIFNPSAKTMAAIVSDGNDIYVTLNDEKGDIQVSKKYPKGRYALARLTVSPDGQKVAFQLCTPPTLGTCSMVVDGKETAAYESIYDFKFSPDGNHYAMEVRKKAGEYGEVMVIDGNEGLTFDLVKEPVFSADGKSVAYIGTSGLNEAQQTGKEDSIHTVIVFNGKTITPLGQAEHLSLSPDGQTLAYSVRDISTGVATNYVVIGTTKAPSHGFVKGPILFSRDSRQVAYIANNYSKGVNVVVGSNVSPFPSTATIDPSSLVFGPDNKTVAFTKCESVAGISKVSEPHCSVIVGSQEGQKYQKVWKPVFSPDGKYIGYGAMKDNQLWWIAEKIQ